MKDWRVWLLGLIIVLPVAVYILLTHKEKPLAYTHPFTCASVIKQQLLTMQMYTSDFDDHYPLAYSWYSATFPYRKTNDLGCPVVRAIHPGQTGYAYDSRLHGLPAKKVVKPEAQPMIYDSTSLAADSSDPYTSLPIPGRHDGTNSVGYADGHMHAVPDKRGR